MTEEIIASLRRALTTGQLAILLYRPEAVLESYVNGHREVFTSLSAISEKWPEVVGDSGTETHFAVVVEQGGYEIDVQRSTASGRRLIRQIHRLHVVDGGIERHLIYPALPKEPASVPVGSLTSVLPGSLVDFQHGGLSGAAMFRARLNTGEPVVVKHIRPARDWLARATRDPGREALLHTGAVYDGLPPEIASPVIEATRVDDGWLIVMRDVHAALDVVRTADRPAMSEAMLAAAYAMHVKFMGAEPAGFLCSLADRLRLFSPIRPLVERRGSDTLPKTLTGAWECFADLADHADRALPDAVLRLVMDPGKLLRALRDEAPGTLLHGDYRLANLGFEDGVVVALDWGLACYGPAELDFVWFLSNTAWGDDAERAHLVETWERLTGRDRDSRVLDLAVIFHAVMGEVAFLMAEARHQPPGFPRPSAETVTWWLRRLEEAFERVGDLGAARTDRRDE